MIRQVNIQWIAIHATCCVAVLASGVALGVNPATTRSTSPITELDADAIREVRNVLDHRNLRLTTDESTVAHRFEFLVTMSIPGGRSTIFRVARDADRVGILIRSAAGTPYCYLSKDLLAGFDQSAPGQLVFVERGAPQFVVALTSAADKGDVDFKLGFRSGAKRPEIVVDVDLILRGVLPQAREAKWEKDKRLISLRTGNAMVAVYLPAPDDPDDFGVKGLILRGRTGSLITLSEIRLDCKPSNILSLDGHAFRQIGLPVRSLTNEEVAKLSFFVPPSFPSTEIEARAAGEVAKLLNGVRSAATTQHMSD